MAKILVAGLINIETTVKIDGFPIEYIPVRYPFYGIRTTVSGVGYNVAKALKTLGNEIDFLSLIGDDIGGESVRTELDRLNIPHKHVLSHLKETCQSVILYDPDGKRLINTDLKSIQDTLYPLVHLNLDGVDLAVLCNVNFSRPMLEKVKASGIPIATDVHTISNLDDDYNRDYMAYADILFMSNENLPVSPEEWVHQLWERYGTPIIGIGLGAEGALLAIKDENRIERIPAKALRPIVNTVGSGDSLFSSFVHSYLIDKNTLIAMKKAVLFAGYKIGTSGGGDGFMTAGQLENAYQQHYG